MQIHISSFSSKSYLTLNCRLYSYSSKLTFLCILLVLGGDVELNPGPRSYCGQCNKLDKAVECDGCVKWVHARCTNIDSDEYKKLQLSNPDAKWYCPSCSFPCGIWVVSDPAIECDSCNSWIHNRCSLVSDLDYQNENNLSTAFSTPFPLRLITVILT
ncbi:hypothetical protein HOLleu_02902 [Holothuria leucospilota]|uniref:PHD-type domain-containing protein n=1 Tax=Holothuria leucospilota TaxID=206669 RepID=A0A9Q1HLN0_HOLLE|nr:hypothetical protein HOLleu_02902 [Holothuria leucospilota]